MAKVFKEIDHGCLRVFGPYFIEKSSCTTFRLTFESWFIILRPYQYVVPLLIYTALSVSMCCINYDLHNKQTHYYYSRSCQGCHRR